MEQLPNWHHTNMKKQLQLSIPNPCNESWSDMTQKGLGRHCDKCDHVVVDFTRLSDRQLFDLFAQSNAPMCGKFTRNQLWREISGPPAIPSFSFDLRAVALGLVLLSTVPAFGGTDATNSFSLVTLLEKNESVSVEDSLRATESSDFIRFNLMDSETGEPLVFMKFRFLDSNGVTIGGAYSDMDGFVYARIPEEVPSNIASIKIGSEIDDYEIYTANWSEFKSKTGQTIWLKPKHTSVIMMGIIISQPINDFDIHNPRPSDTWKRPRPGSRD